MWKLTLFLVLPLMMIAGCSVQPTGQRTSNDTDVTANVQKVVENMQGVDPTQVDVRTQNGNVTLTGKVVSPSARDNVGEVVALVKGVDNVTNNLEVQSASPAGTGAGTGTTTGTQPTPQAQPPTTQQPSQQPAQRPSQQPMTQPSQTRVSPNEVNSALKSSNALSGLNINVKTRNGTVILTGTVPNQASRELAERIARQQQGVTSVQNNLMVKPQARQQ